MRCKDCEKKDKGYSRLKTSFLCSRKREEDLRQEKFRLLSQIAELKKKLGGIK